MITADKVRKVLSTVDNWPVVALDRAGLARHVTYRTRSGLTFRCRGGTSDVTEVVAIVSGHEYDPRFLELPEGSVVLDLGANIGAFVAYVTLLNSGRRLIGHAFEPYAPNFELLEVNCALNGTDAFALHPVAVTGTDGTVLLDASGDPDAVHVTTGGGTPVRSVRLDTFCRDHGLEHVDLLKMDVEGSEYEIVESAWETISSTVQRIVLEYHDPPDAPAVLALESRLREVFEVERRFDRILYCSRR